MLRQAAGGPAHLGGVVTVPTPGTVTGARPPGPKGQIWRSGTRASIGAVRQRPPPPPVGTARLNRRTWRCEDLVPWCACGAQPPTARSWKPAGPVGAGPCAAARVQAQHPHGSRRNIAAHTTGNGCSSCSGTKKGCMASAVFDERASRWNSAAAQLDRICRKLTCAGPALSDRTAGGMAMYAAANFGCRVTTTTISRAYALVPSAGQGRLRGPDHGAAEDYRDLQGNTTSWCDRDDEPSPPVLETYSQVRLRSSPKAWRW